MTDILDSDLLKEQQKEALCKKIRFYTLIFTGVMASIFLSMNLAEMKGGRGFLLVGLIAIALQSTVCFISMKRKTWIAGIRMIITVAATAYILYLMMTTPLSP